MAYLYLLAFAGGVVLVGLVLTRPRRATGADHEPTIRSDRHPFPRDRSAAIEWAREVMKNKSKYVILDTETTGRGADDEIVQLAVIDLEGNTLFNENIRPTRKKEIHPEALAKHGLTMESVSKCKTFSQFAGALEQAIGDRTILAYNAKFDVDMYVQTYRLAGGFFGNGGWKDVMAQYAKYVGQWNDKYGDYRWQKLPSAIHGAVGDCLATLKVLRTMAATDS